MQYSKGDILGLHIWSYRLKLGATLPVSKRAALADWHPLISIKNT